MKIPFPLFVGILVCSLFVYAEASSSSINWLTKNRADSLYMVLLTCSDNEIMTYDLGSSSWVCDTDQTGSGGGVGLWFTYSDNWMRANISSGGVGDVDVDKLNTTELCINDFCIADWEGINQTFTDTDTTINNCSVDMSCDPVFYDSEFSSSIIDYWNMSKVLLHWNNLTGIPKLGNTTLEIWDVCSNLTFAYIDLISDYIHNDSILREDIWVNESGDTMTGILDMSADNTIMWNNVLNLSCITSVLGVCSWVFPEATSSLTLTFNGESIIFDNDEVKFQNQEIQIDPSTDADPMIQSKDHPQSGFNVDVSGFPAIDYAGDDVLKVDSNGNIDIANNVTATFLCISSDCSSYITHNGTHTIIQT